MKFNPPFFILKIIDIRTIDMRLISHGRQSMIDSPNMIGKIHIINCK